jgi:hypothetical protein
MANDSASSHMIQRVLSTGLSLPSVGVLRSAWRGIMSEAMRERVVHNRIAMHIHESYKAETRVTYTMATFQCI